MDITNNKCTNWSSVWYKYRKEGTGSAGNLVAIADSIRLKKAASLRAESRAGSQGNIIVNADIISLRQGSNITTNATGSATGGNITINSPIILGFENSDITANAVKGNGGNIQLTTQSIFGFGIELVADKSSVNIQQVLTCAAVPKN